jgi:hypothetical protein
VNAQLAETRRMALSQSKGLSRFRFDALRDAPLAHGLPAGQTRAVNEQLAETRRMALSQSKG